MNIRVLRQSLPSDRTVGGSWSNCIVTNRSRSWTYTCASSFVCTSPSAVTTVVGFLDLRNVSISSELKSFLLSMCIEALQFPTHIRPSVFFRLAPGTYFHRRIKRSSCPRLWVFFLVKSHAALRAHSSCLEVSSSVLSSIELGRARISLMGFNFSDNTSRWPFTLPNLNFGPSSCEFFRRSVQSRLPSFPQNRLL